MPKPSQTEHEEKHTQEQEPMTDKTRRKPRNFNASGEAGLLLGFSPPSGFARQKKNGSLEND
jgi:hypothetical protein